MPNFEVRGVVVVGKRLAKSVAVYLIEKSAWFEVTPLPANEWQCIYKPENHEAVKAVLPSCSGAWRDTWKSSPKPLIPIGY